MSTHPKIITMKATKTEAATTNNVDDLADWVEQRNAFWNGPAGDMLIFHNETDTAQPANTIRADWNNNVGYGYAFQKYTNGTNAQELAKWHFNLVTTYTVAGSLKASKWAEHIAGFKKQRSVI